MKDRPAIRPQRLFFAHNALLSAFSLFLLGCFLEILVPTLLRRGVFWSICNPGALTARLEWLYYLNYLTKYYELVDTVFLVIKKKKLGKSCGDPARRPGTPRLIPKSLSRTR